MTDTRMTGRKSGLTAFEMIVAVTALGIVATSLMSALLGLTGTMRSKPLAIRDRDARYETVLPDGEVPMVNSTHALSLALPFHLAFAEVLDRSRGVYVFGAKSKGQAAADDSWFSQKPLDFEEFPDIAVDGVLPTSSYDFYQLYIRGSGTSREWLYHDEDYTVVLVGDSEGDSKVIGVAQHRRLEFEADEEDIVVRQSRLWTEQGEWGYDVGFDPERDDLRGSPPGAERHWLRFVEPDGFDEGLLEEGLLIISWPDPKLVMGSSLRAQNGAPLVSKYTYVTPVSK